MNALDEAAAFVAYDSLRAARSLMRDAFAQADSLCEFSERGRHSAEAEDENIREIFVQRYRIVYRVTPSAVIVLAFVHQSRERE